jgi:hypothetical protein
METVKNERLYKTTTRSDVRVSNFDKEGKRILPVEDQEDARDLPRLTLAEYAIVCARNFDEGLRLARQ